MSMPILRPYWQNELHSVIASADFGGQNNFLYII